MKSTILIGIALLFIGRCIAIASDDTARDRTAHSRAKNLLLAQVSETTTTTTTAEKSKESKSKDKTAGRDNESKGRETATTKERTAEKASRESEGEIVQAIKEREAAERERREAERAMRETAHTTEHRTGGQESAASSGSASTGTRDDPHRPGGRTKKFKEDASPDPHTEGGRPKDKPQP